MTERPIIGIIAVQKRDSNHVIGNLFHGVKVAKNKTHAAAMAVQDYLNLIRGKQFLYAFHNLRNQLVTEFFPPRRPALKSIFEIYNHDRFLREQRPNESSLCPNMLDVIAPFIRGIWQSPNGLFDRIT